MQAKLTGVKKSNDSSARKIAGKGTGKTGAKKTAGITDSRGTGKTTGKSAVKGVGKTGAKKTAGIADSRGTGKTTGKSAGKGVGKTGARVLGRTAAIAPARTSAKETRNAVKGTLKSPVFAQVYEIVRRIPVGKVLTYGLISNLMESRLSAQGVGWALNALPARAREGKDGYSAQTVPWHRVINARGGLSTNKIADIPPGMQKCLLEAEGIVFNQEEKLSLELHLWVDGLKA